MERKRMDQIQLARALGVSRSAVNAWINDRAYPQNSVGALEEVLGVSLGAEPGPDLVDDETRALIYRKFTREQAAVIIAAIEQTVRPGITSPDGDPAPSPAR